MPIGYLITAVLLGACTLAALWPLRCQSAVGTVVYLDDLCVGQWS